MTTDRAAAYPRVLDEQLPAAHHIDTRYASNKIEADHGRLKARLRPMRGLKRLRSAQVIGSGHAFVQNLRRGHYELGIDTEPQHRLAAAFTELAPGHLTTQPTCPSHALGQLNGTEPSRPLVAGFGDSLALVLRRGRSFCRSFAPVGVGEVAGAADLAVAGGDCDGRAGHAGEVRIDACRVHPPATANINMCGDLRCVECVCKQAFGARVADLRCEVRVLPGRTRNVTDHVEL